MRKQENNTLQKEIEDLREKNRELQETLDAIRSGEVDAIVVSKGETLLVYTLEGADHPYRALIENIQEAALTLTRTGIILYCNTRFADLVKVPPEKVPGTSILDYICPENRTDAEEALDEILKKLCRMQIRIRQGFSSIPVLLSMNPLSSDEETKISVVITDRRKDDEKIRLQALMLDAVGDAVFAVDINQKIIYWNDKATKTYGWKPEEVIGHEIKEINNANISKEVVWDIKAHLTKGDSWSGELVGHHRDGHEFPIYVSFGTVFDNDGKIIAFIGVGYDISERKQAEEALRESESRARSSLDDLTSVMNSVPAAIWIAHDPDALHITGNVLSYEWLHIPYGSEASKSALEGKKPETFRMFKNGVELQPIDMPVQQAAKGKIICDYEFEFVYPDGSIRNVLGNANPKNDQNGNPTGSVASFIDITKRKQAEEELRENEEKFRSLAENLPSILMRYDRNLRVVYLSQNAESILGKSPYNFIGRTNREMGMPENLISLWENAISEVFRSGHSQDLEFNFPAPTGVMTFYLQLVPERDQNGGVRYVLGISTNISERKLMEEALNRRYIELTAAYEEISSIQKDLRRKIEELTLREEQLNAALSEREVLLREIHHRVKNNLATIISLINLQLKTLDSESDVSHFKGLESRIRSMVLIHETLYKSKNYSHISMDSYLTSLVHYISEIFDVHQDIQIDFNLDQVFLSVDSAIPCGMVVNEIITNAFKYAFPPGFICEQERGCPSTISITLKMEGQHVLLSIADNGIGMPIETFNRNKKIGLSMIQIIVPHQLRGTIDITHTCGTHYLIKIPLN